MKRCWREGRVIAGIVIAVWVMTAAGCESAPQPALPPVVTRFFLESRPGDKGIPVELPQSGVTVAVGAKPVITEFDIVGADVVQVDLGRCLRVRLTPAAARDLYRLSTAATGRRLVLWVDDRALGARRIEGPMTDGAILVFVEVPDAQLADLVARVNQTSVALATGAKNAKTE